MQEAPRAGSLPLHGEPPTALDDLVAPNTTMKED